MESRVFEDRIGFRAELLGNDWAVTSGDATVGSIALRAREGRAEARLEDGTIWRMTADGWGLIRLIEAGVPFARATRDPSNRRRWHISGPGIDCYLVPLRMGRWKLETGAGEELARLGQVYGPGKQWFMKPSSPIPAAVALLVWMALVVGIRRRPGPGLRPLRQRQEPSADGAV